jgi:AraC-like DNA-binding protein
MHYAERPPSATLAPYVKCIWRFESESPGKPDRIVPDGRPELIVHRGARFAELDARGAHHLQPGVLFAGQVTRSLRLRATGPAAVMGVRFHPHGARAFVGVSMRELTDRRIAIEMAHDPEEDVDGALARVEAFVAERIASSRHPEDLLARAMSERIEAADGMINAEALFSDAAVGRRQAERRFADAVGIGPALLASIFRFRRVFDVIERGGPRPWTEAALAAGYYDQSHFIREFRRFVGCTPSEFEAERSGLASALVEA